MNKWIYKGKQIKCVDDLDPCCMFSTYEIFFPKDETYYYGSKQIFFTRRVKLSKKKANELYSGKGGKKKYEIVKKESDWLTYKSSSKIVQEKLANGEKAVFRFLGFYETKREMLLNEANLIINAFLVKDKDILNSWIKITMFKDKN